MSLPELFVLEPNIPGGAAHKPVRPRSKHLQHPDGFVAYKWQAVCGVEGVVFTDSELVRARPVCVACVEALKVAA